MLPRIKAVKPENCFKQVIFNVVDAEPALDFHAGYSWAADIVISPRGSVVYYIQIKVKIGI